MIKLLQKYVLSASGAFFDPNLKIFLIQNQSNGRAGRAFAYSIPSALLGVIHE